MARGYKPTSGWGPGKGFFGDLTQESITWLKETIEEVWDAYGETGDEDYGNDGEEGVLKFLKVLGRSANGWNAEKDSFGTKLYKELPWSDWADGTHTKYRLTVVCTSRGELKIDIRQWANFGG